MNEKIKVKLLKLMVFLKENNMKIYGCGCCDSPALDFKDEKISIGNFNYPCCKYFDENLDDEQYIEKLLENSETL